jgi:hypothetical protein
MAAVRESDVVVTMGSGRHLSVLPRQSEVSRLGGPAGSELERLRPIRRQIRRLVVRPMTELALSLEPWP